MTIYVILKRMPEDIENIVESIEFEKKEEFRILLQKSIQVSTDSSNDELLENPNLVFKLDTFFKGFPLFINEFGKDKKYRAGVHALKTILENLGVDIEEEDCFILFHVRDLGKFRKREEKLYAELTELWGRYKDYKLEKQDFSYSLKELMRKKLIGYRRGNITFNPSVLIRYRKEK